MKKIMSILVILCILISNFGNMGFVFTDADAATVVPLSINYSDFSVSDMALNGTAVVSGGALTLTPSQNDQIGSAFYQQKISLENDKSFSTYFTWNVTNPGATKNADGFVFVLNSSTSGLGDKGSGMGFDNIDHSVGIEFDTFDNGNDAGDSGLGANHIAVDIDGSVDTPVATATNSQIASVMAVSGSAVAFEDGSIYHAWVDYDGLTHNLQVRMSTSNVRPATPVLQTTINLASSLGAEEVYAGFTASTGGFCEEHNIRSWYLMNDYSPIDLSGSNTYASAPNNISLSTSPASGASSYYSFTAVVTRDGIPATYAPVKITTTNGSLSTTSGATNANGQISFSLSYSNLAGSASVKVTAQGGAYATSDVTLQAPTVPAYQPVVQATATPIPNSNTNLASLKVNVGTLSPAFSKTVTQYDLGVVENSVSSLNLTASTEDSSSTMQVKINDGCFVSLSRNSESPKLSLNDGLNTITLLVTAKNGDTKSYTITVKRIGLKSLLTDLRFMRGEFNSGFDPSRMTYELKNLPDIADNIQLIANTYNDNKLQLSVNGGEWIDLVSGELSGNQKIIPSGNNTFRIKVIDAINRETVYTVTTAANQSRLSSLELSEGSLSPAFAKDVYHYNAGVVKNTVDKLKVTALPEYKNSIVAISVNNKEVSGGTVNLAEGQNEISITVKGEDNKVSTYTVTVSRLSKDRTNAKSLKVIVPAHKSSGGSALDEKELKLVPDFDPAISQYTVSYNPKEDSDLSILTETFDSNVAVRLADTLDSVDGKAVTNGDLLTKNTIISMSGKTVVKYLDFHGINQGSGNSVYASNDNKVYKITFVPQSNDTSLKSFELAGTKVNVKTSVKAGSTSYSIKVDYYTSEVTIKNIIPNDPMVQKIEYQYEDYETKEYDARDTITIPLTAACTNHLKIWVTASDGTRKAFIVGVTRDVPDLTLSSLSVKGFKFKTSFSPATSSYSINDVGYITDEVRIDAKLSDTNRVSLVARINGGAYEELYNGYLYVPLEVGTNKIEVKAYIPNTNRYKIYTITIKRNEPVLKLKNIRVSSFNIGFDPDKTEYELEVGNASKTLAVNYELSEDLGSESYVEVTCNGAYPKYDSKLNLICNLAEGKNIVKFVLHTAMNKTRTYTVIVRRKSTDAMIKSVEFDNPDLTAITTKAGVLEYDAGKLTTAKSSIKLKIVPGYDRQKLSIRYPGASSFVDLTGDTFVEAQLLAGINTFQIKVKPELGDEQIYTITLSRGPSETALLKNISFTEGTLTTAFDPNSFTYSLAQKVVGKNMKVSAVLGENAAKVSYRVNGSDYKLMNTSGQSDSLRLVDDTNQVDLKVEAKDGSTNIYSITVVKKSNDAGLTSVKCSESTMSLEGDTYKGTVIATTEGVHFTVKTKDPNATINIGSFNRMGSRVNIKAESGVPSPLVPTPRWEKNEIYIEVTSESGLVTKIYPVVINRKIPTKPHINSIYNMTFSPDVLTYKLDENVFSIFSTIIDVDDEFNLYYAKVSLDDSTETVDTSKLEWIPILDKHHVEIPYPHGKGRIYLKVTNYYDAKRIYELNTNVKEESAVTLESIQISGNNFDEMISGAAINTKELSMPGFDDNLDYAKYVLTLNKRSEGQTISVDNAEIKLISKEGKTEKYALYPLRQDYQKFTIKVTAQDKMNSGEYIIVTKRINNTSRLVNLNISRALGNQYFDPTVTENNMELAKGVKDANIDVTCYKGQTIKVQFDNVELQPTQIGYSTYKASNLSSGTHVLKVTTLDVTGKKSLTYTCNIITTDKLSDNTKVDSIRTYLDRMTYQQGVTEYSFVADELSDKIPFVITKNDPEALIGIEGSTEEPVTDHSVHQQLSFTPKYGDNVFRFYILAEDKVHRTDYTIRIHRDYPTEFVSGYPVLESADASSLVYKLKTTRDSIVNYVWVEADASGKPSQMTFDKTVAGKKYTFSRSGSIKVNRDEETLLKIGGLDQNTKYRLYLQVTTRDGSYQSEDVVLTGQTSSEYSAPSVADVFFTSKAVKGTCPALSEVSVYRGDTLLGKGESGTKGEFSIAIPEQKEGTELKVTYKLLADTSITKSTTVKVSGYVKVKLTLLKTVDGKYIVRGKGTANLPISFTVMVSRANGTGYSWSADNVNTTIDENGNIDLNISDQLKNQAIALVLGQFVEVTVETQNYATLKKTTYEETTVYPTVYNRY